MSTRSIKLIVAVLLPLLVWMMPAAWIPIQGMTVVEHRLLALFVFAVAFWILEPISIFATSVLIILIQLLTMSDGGFAFFKSGGVELGPLLSYKAVMGNFAHPVIMLFLGGFFLAAAATKYRLDVNLARVLVKPFGTRPSLVILGLMAVTAIFSMFMSNTACTAMMLAVLAPVLRAMPEGDRGRTAMALSIPTAANIGGIGTPIGTPPNAVAMKYLTGAEAISFGQWMLFAVPFALVLLVIGWQVLLRLYRPQCERLEVDIKGRFQRSPQAITVYVTFALTILLWMTGGFLHELKSYVVALIPVGVFVATGVMSAKDMKGLGWDVLWLIAGGFALGAAMEQTGLSRHLIDSIPFDSFAPMLILVAASAVTLAMATFMSHTATANLLMPIMAGLGATLASLEAIGGGAALILGVTFAASLGMALPISTPPNAMAHATGMVSSKQMAAAGTIICLIGLAMTFAMLWVLNLAGFFVTA